MRRRSGFMSRAGGWRAANKMRTAGPQPAPRVPRISASDLICGRFDTRPLPLAEQPNVHAVRAEDGDFGLGADHALLAVFAARAGVLDPALGLDHDWRAATATIEAVHVRV